jgi:hypothetical protein
MNEVLIRNLTPRERIHYGISTPADELEIVARDLALDLGLVEKEELEEEEERVGELARGIEEARHGLRGVIERLRHGSDMLTGKQVDELIEDLEGIDDGLWSA